MGLALALASGASGEGAAHAAETAKRSAMTVQRLRWDGRDRPLGLIQFEPRLSWAVSSPHRGDRQTAYQVLVAHDPANLVPGRADLWDSGKVVSAETLNVRYAGPAPHARQRAYYTVRVWDAEDRPSSFAPPSWWEMGLYDEEWMGQWIGRPTKAAAPGSVDRDGPSGGAAPEYDRSANYLRKAFALPKGWRKARLYASAFGVYRISVNGQAAHDTVLVPGFTDYEKRVLFQTYDVGALLRPGDNVIGAIVGGGWCTAALGRRAGACGHEPPRIMLQLEVTLANGELFTLVTDESWHAHPGPIVATHLADGESYDARAELPGWDVPQKRPVVACTGRDRRACGRPSDGESPAFTPVQQYDREKSAIWSLTPPRPCA